MKTSRTCEQANRNVETAIEKFSMSHAGIVDQLAQIDTLHADFTAITTGEDFSFSFSAHVVQFLHAVQNEFKLRPFKRLANKVKHSSEALALPEIHSLVQYLGFYGEAVKTGVITKTLEELGLAIEMAKIHLTNSRPAASTGRVDFVFYLQGMLLTLCGASRAK